MRSKQVNNTVRIGTRDSVLAMWQAHFISDAIEALGLKTEIIQINTKGDSETTVPLYEFGVTGIFTKSLDIALLEDKIDIAVHSMKDVPTVLPKGIVEFAVPERGMTYDVMVYNGTEEEFKSNTSRTIATSSLRRQAQWLHKFKNDTLTGIRGNVITRLEKLAKNPWDGAIFAEVGLKRINRLPENAFRLDWMIPAAAQGALLVVGQSQNTELHEIVSQLNHEPTSRAVKIERHFMHDLNAGCTAPVGAYAVVSGNEINFTGVVTSLDGSQHIEIKKTVNITEVDELGGKCASEILEMGAREILAEIRNNE